MSIAAVSTAAILSLSFSPVGRTEVFPPLIGLSGTSGDDVITLTSPVEAAVGETVYEVGLIDVSAIGVDTLLGNDTIGTQGSGTVTIHVEGDALTVLVGLGVGVNASGVGIDAGPDDDSISLGAPISVTSRAQTDTGTATLFFEQVPSILGFSATASGTGLVGGLGADSLANDSQLSVFASAANNLLQLTLTPVELPADVFGLGLTPITSDALAIGLSADAGAASCQSLLQDCVTDPNAAGQSMANSGTLEVDAKATVAGSDVSVTLAGSSRSDTSSHAHAASIGFLGGVGSDSIVNSGSLDIDAYAQASSNGVEVIADTLPFPVPSGEVLEYLGVPIAESDVVAEARAVGIDAGGGDDMLTNTGTDGQIGAGPTRSLEDLSASLAGKNPTQITDFIDALGLAIPSADYCDDDSTSNICALAKISTFDLALEFPLPAKGPSIGPASMTGFINILPILTEGDEEPSFSEMSTRAVANAIGFDGGEGRDEITNNSPFAIESHAVAQSTSIAITLAEVGTEELFPLDIAFSETQIGAKANALGLAGGDGEDRISNTDVLGVLSTTRLTSSSITVDAAFGKEGISASLGLGDASTIGASFAAGIDGMGGADDITNTGSIGTEAYSEIITQAIAVSVSVTGTGFVADVSLLAAESSAQSESIGIDGGEHDSVSGSIGDTILNTGSVETRSEANALAKSISVAANFAKTGIAIGGSLAATDATAEASATGIQTDAGNDFIANLHSDTESPQGGVINAESNATAVSDSTAVTLTAAYEGIALGVSAASANTEAIATSTGIASGAGGDVIHSGEGTVLTSRATADSTANSRAITLEFAPISVGASIAGADLRSDATARGISSGDGTDAVVNSGLIDVDAEAATHAKSVSVNFSLAGVGFADATTKAISYANGMEGGGNSDTLSNLGVIDVYANASLDTLGATGNLIGYARGDLVLSAETKAFGMVADDEYGGSGAENTITNAKDASIDVTARANANADAYVVNGGGAASAKAGSTADVLATGILGGSGIDTIGNLGGLDVMAESINSAISFGFTGVGFQTVDADVSAKATATGIDAGEGANIITNSSTGNIGVHTQVENLAGSVGAGILDFNLTSADASARTTASGIRSGDEVDVITNEGVIDVTAQVFNDAGTGAIGLLSFGFVNNLSSAALEGINVGGGDDFITNKGTITVGRVIDTPAPGKCLHPTISCARAATFGLDLIGLGLADLGSLTTVTGLAGGGGADTIVNDEDASLTVGDDSNWMVFTETDSIAASIGAVFNINLAFGTAEVESIGMDGGEGDDHIANAGELTVNARSATDVYAEIEIGVGLTTSYAIANAQAVATAKGVAGGGGDDSLENNGSLTIRSHAKTYPRAVMDVGISGADSTAESFTDATAIGMVADTGSNIIRNLGDGAIDVDAFGEAQASTSTDTGAFVQAKSTGNDIAVNSSAWGMRTGAGVDVLSNSGGMTVTARAGEEGPYSIDAFGEDIAAVGPPLGDNNPDLPVVTNPGLRMNASATGIQSGAGQDEITNAGALEVTALSNGRGKAATDSADLTRDDTADISVHAQAIATGLHGAGDTGFTNTATGTLRVTAKTTGLAYAKTDGNLDARSDAWIRAKSSAIGILAEGYGRIDNAGGTIEVVARAEPLSDAYANEGGGQYGESRASGLAETQAAGIKIGDSGSSIVNRPNGTVNVAAFSGGLGEWWVRSRADNTVKSNGIANADATGFLAGNGVNQIDNQGSLVVGATARSRVDVGNIGSGDPDLLVENSSADASATGIRTGTAGDHIWNYGDITVTASADAWYRLGTDADKKYFSVTATSSAMGIASGDGDDIIYNDTGGSIITSQTAMEYGAIVMNSAGTAIDSGIGNDAVYLHGDSLAVGRILLGAGDDVLSFRDSAQLRWAENGADLAGIVDGGDGLDTLRIGGRNSFTIGPPLSMEILGIDQGQLGIEGDYALATDGLLRVTIYNPEALERGHGQLVVIGDVTLDGTLSVVALPRLYRNGETFDVLVAESIAPASDFTQLGLPAATPLLSFSLVDPRPGDSIVRVQTSVNPFDTVARYPLQQRIAAYLDQITPMASGDLAALLGAFQLTPADGLDRAFSSLSPDSYQAFTALTAINGFQYLRGMQQQMLTLRAPMMSAGFADLGKDLYRLAYQGGNLGGLGVSTAPGVGMTQDRNLSMGGFLVSGSQDSSGGYAGYDYTSWGVSLSPQLVHRNSLVGVSLGYTLSDVDFADHSGSGDISAWYAGIFGSLYNADAYLEAGLAVSDQEYVNQRNIRIDGLGATAKSKHGGEVTQAFIGTGYTFQTKNWAMQPFASLYYFVIDEEGFTETGAEAANLTVEGEKTESLISEAGMRVSRGLTSGSADLDLDLSVSLVHDFDIDDRKVTASLLGAPGTTFTIDDRDTKQTSAVIGAGLTYKRGNSAASLQYQGQFNGDHDSHALMATVGVRF